MKKSLTIQGLTGYIIVSVICALVPFPTIAAQSIISVTLNGSSAVTVPPAAAISVQISVMTTGSGATNDWQSTYWAIGITASGCVDHADHTSSGTFAEAFTIAAPTAIGVYTAKFIAHQNDTCGQGSSPSFTLTNGVTVTSESASPSPTFSPTPTPSSSSTPTPTVSPTPTPTPTAIPTPTPSPTVTPSPSPTPSPTVSPMPSPSPTPNGSISDIRYVSFTLIIDADPANDPPPVTVQSQVQLRNLKTNL